MRVVIQLSSMVLIKATSKTYKDVNLSNFIPSIQISETVKEEIFIKIIAK